MANERRLIDSAELISKLPIVEEDKQISLIGAVADVVTMISECKPVDAIVPVRCKDCKYGEIDDLDFPDQFYCHSGCGWNEGNFFCAYGEKSGT